jgi:hypothetical protein
MRDCERPHPFSKLTAAVKKCAMARVENAPATQQTKRLAAWIESCVAHNQAAALYDRLSRLSNAELHPRGFTRATLERDVCDACAPRVR